MLAESGSEEGPVAFALLLDGQGGARPLSVVEQQSWQPEDGFLWLHLDGGDPRAESLLAERFGLEPATREAMLDRGGHPRLLPQEEGALLILQTLPVMPVVGSHGLGLWLEARRALSLSPGKPPLVARLREQLLAGAGPALPAELPASLLRLLAEDYRDRLKGMLEQADRLQERVCEDQSRDMQTQLSLLRRHAARLGGVLDDSLRLVDDLLAQDLSWLIGKPHKAIREQRDRMHRLLGEMRNLREHLHSLQDELNGLLDHRLNQRVYQLTVITGVCFPMVFITGLLGVNVGGIPGASNPNAFWLLCGVLVALGLVGGWLLHRRNWL